MTFLLETTRKCVKKEMQSLNLRSFQEQHFHNQDVNLVIPGARLKVLVLLDGWQGPWAGRRPSPVGVPGGGDMPTV